ncbi:unnamed protein product [Pieris macdunnoughi]|uniref:Regulatory protein zeste n=1 Tax=Pieris macdunnoughi TaxID=345717 RepID=A0A821QV22_9NEOP|nr:unnamed protein product [Pieris macdunnoughi]
MCYDEFGQSSHKPIQKTFVTVTFHQNSLKGFPDTYTSALQKLFREVLADYVVIIEDKCTDTNTNKRKYHAWQKVFESFVTELIKFNKLNVRQRALVELKQQWQMSKVDAKKIMSEHRIAKNKSGGSRPPSPDEETINLVKLLPLEFEVDHNKLDSDASQIVSATVSTVYMTSVDTHVHSSQLQ